VTSPAVIPSAIEICARAGDGISAGVAANPPSPARKALRPIVMKTPFEFETYASD
jgi:hypothetical protein